MLVGKEGSSIAALRKESGARIQITDHTDERGERIVKLGGTPAQVDAAATMIEAKLGEAAARAAERGGKALKQAKRPRAAKPARRTETVPEFDKQTGQLVMVERLVEADEAEQAEEVNEAAEAPSEKRVKKLQRFDKETGERTHYFRDEADGGPSLKEMVAAERKGGAGGRDGPGGGRVYEVDRNMADHISRQAKFKGMDVDAEYDHDDVEIADDRRSKQSDAKRAKGEQAQQKAWERNQSLTAQRAEDRFNSVKHLVIALGEYVVLLLQPHSPLSDGHCTLQPVEHVASLSEASEEVAEEVRNFKKCLIRMAEQRGEVRPANPRAQPANPRAQPANPRAQPAAARAQPAAARAQPATARVLLFIRVGL